MWRAKERRGEPEAEATYFAGHFPLFWETTATTLAGLSARASSPRSPSSFPQHRPKPNQTSGHPSGHSTAPRPQPPPERTERRGDEADVPYFGCRKVLWEASVVDRVNNNSQRPRVILCLPVECSCQNIVLCGVEITRDIQVTKADPSLREEKPF